MALANKPVHYVLLTDSFYHNVFKTIETLILNVNRANVKQLSGPGNYQYFRETGPQVRSALLRLLLFDISVSSLMKSLRYSN